MKLPLVPVRYLLLVLYGIHFGDLVVELLFDLLDHVLDQSRISLVIDVVIRF